MFKGERDGTPSESERHFEYRYVGIWRKGILKRGRRARTFRNSLKDINDSRSL